MTDFYDSGDNNWLKWKDDLLNAVGASYQDGKTKDQVEALANGGSRDRLNPYNVAWDECQQEDTAATHDDFVALAMQLYSCLDGGMSLESTRARGRGGAF